MAIARVLERVLADGELRQSLAAAGQLRVKQFAWPLITDRYRVVYSTVCTRGIRSRHRVGAR